MSDGEKILKINIEEEMKSSYIDYSMSVIVSRALPDVRDGLKPVHRRVLYGMSELGVSSNKPTKKSARIVGEVLGKYHPHGDSSVYYAMVRLAQWWAMRYPLVDGQGNFGSIDGDGPAAMRYTEARLRRIAEEMLEDIDKDTVDMVHNFDDTLWEPTVLPTKIPYLLVNGASGIAVGMATNMPPHNLSEIVDALCATVDNDDITIDELMEIVTAPDFPTGGIIYGKQGIRDAFETGRGRIVIRGKAEIETDKSGRNSIIVTEIPYNVNKAEMIKKTAELINEKKIEGISNLNDETDMSGMRIVYELKKDANPSVVLNKLYKYTELQSSFSVNNIALVDGRPYLLNLKDLLVNFIKHRHEVVLRRAKFDLRKAEERAHILQGLIIASDNIDEVIAIIKAAKSPEDALEELIKRFSLTEIQARAIVDMRLRQLTGLEQDKLRAEYAEIEKQIAYLRDVISNVDLRKTIIKDELIEIKEKYGDSRRTEVVPDAGEFNPEDFYADEDVVITISQMGYIKRTSLSEFRTQSRGGVGAKGSNTRDEDVIEHLYSANMHGTMLFFTQKGRCHWLRVFEIPEGTRTSKGRAIQNILQIDADDAIKAYINVKTLSDQEYIKNHYVMLVSKKGIVKKTTLEAYSRPRANGINAITIREDDALLAAQLTDGNYEVLLGVRSGKACRFMESELRPMGRMASGVKGVGLDGDDEVVGVVCQGEEKHDVLVVSENGYGKRSDIDEYRMTHRGSKGVKTINVTDKTGPLVAVMGVVDTDDLMIITKNGLAIRQTVDALRVMGRATQGVKLINLRANDAIAAVTAVPHQDEEEVTDGEQSETNGEQSNAGANEPKGEE
ncbi:MAG: DNA gyrase subunit A [Salinivirgaceae bacterium]|nr:DNA gyrase subunit A [Salinivirgaceae bacterium]